MMGSWDGGRWHMIRKMDQEEIERGMKARSRDERGEGARLCVDI